MSGAMSTERNDVFQDRLKRIQEKNAPDPVDLVDADGNPIPDRTGVSPLPDWKANMVYPMTLVLAAVFGLVAVLLVRLARFHLMDGTLAGGEAGDVAMIMDIGIAMVVGVLVFSILRLRSAGHFLVQGVAVMVMALFMHNMVHSSPKLFDLIFSPEWTADVVSTTEPASVLFRGVSHGLIPEKEEEKVMPTVRRL